MRSMLGYTEVVAWSYGEKYTNPLIFIRSQLEIQEHRCLDGLTKKINSLADIKGLKMRIPGIGGEVLKEAGGIPVTPLPGGELFTALQTGVIDATEWVGRI